MKRPRTRRTSDSLKAALCHMGLELGKQLRDPFVGHSLVDHPGLQSVTEPRPITCGQLRGRNREGEPCGINLREHDGECPFHTFQDRIQAARGQS